MKLIFEGKNKRDINEALMSVLTNGWPEEKFCLYCLPEEGDNSDGTYTSVSIESQTDDSR